MIFIEPAEWGETIALLRDHLYETGHTDTRREALTRFTNLWGFTRGRTVEQAEQMLDEAMSHADFGAFLDSYKSLTD